MAVRLPYKVDVIHGVGLANTLEAYKNFGFIDDIKSDIKQAAASQKRLLMIKHQLDVFKNILINKELTLQTFAETYKGFALKFLERNVLTYDYKQHKLNTFGLNIRLIQRSINYNSVTDTGSLLQFYKQGKDTLETVELTLKSYYESININPLLPPNQKHNQFIQTLGLNLDWLSLEKEILESFNSDNIEVQKFRKSRLLGDFIVDNINARFLLGHISNDTIEYFSLLYSNQLLSIDLATLFRQTITYDLIGSSIRFYLALAAEAVLTASYYINSLDLLILSMRIDDFGSSNYLTERQQLSNYLSLSRVIFFIFKDLRIFEEADVIYEGFNTDLDTVIVDPELLSTDYTLGDFY